MERYLESNENYYYPFRYTDPTLGNKEECYLLKSDEHYVRFLHPFTYQYFKNKNKLEKIKHISNLKSLYMEHIDELDTYSSTYETIYCRELPPSSVKGTYQKEVGTYIPTDYLNISLPEEIEHHINIIFEVLEYTKLHYYRNKPKIEWVFYAADKISTLPLQSEVKHILFNTLCQFAVNESERRTISLTSKFRSDNKKYNESFYEILNKEF